MADEFRCGHVAIVGRANVGKSTLLNRIVGAKVSITSRRPQTTRHRIVGVRSDADAQIVFIDTPGLHGPSAKYLDRVIAKTARGSLEGVDVVVWVIAAPAWQPADRALLVALRGHRGPLVLAINKIDRLAHKERLLPLIEASRQVADFDDIVPVSARRGTNVERLVGVIKARLPVGGPDYPIDIVTDRGERFAAAELVREQVFRFLGQELPYSSAVEIEAFDMDARRARIHAVIWVDKPGHKPIVLGHRGELIKRMGQAARVQMEARFGRKVHLELWVKVRSGWADDTGALRALGYLEDG